MPESAWATGGANLLAAAVGYLLGSIPFGLVLTRLAGAGDLRALGSGNIGATNVLRTGRRGLAALTLLFDGAKGCAAVLLFAPWRAELGLIAGLAAVLGHDFPVWLRFRGGKGVATSLGVLLAAAWPVGGLACLTWAVAALVFRYSSVAALLALAAAPVYAYGLVGDRLTALAAALAVLAVVRHRSNLGRLVRGEEPRIGRKEAPDGP